MPPMPGFFNFIDRHRTLSWQIAGIAALALVPSLSHAACFISASPDSISFNTSNVKSLPRYLEKTGWRQLGQRQIFVRGHCDEARSQLRLQFGPMTSIPSTTELINWPRVGGNPSSVEGALHFEIDSQIYLGEGGAHPISIEGASGFSKKFLTITGIPAARQVFVANFSRALPPGVAFHLNLRLTALLAEDFSLAGVATFIPAEKIHVEILQ